MLLTCPHCRSGLQVPDGTTARVRCPTCKTVIEPPEPEPEPEDEPEDEPAVEPSVLQLICPHCRSGLRVPGGTTALVRCPTCKTVFAPAGNEAPEPEEEQEPPPRKPARDEEDEPPRPKKRPARREADEEPKEEKPENRDFDPIPEDDDRPRKRRPRQTEDEGFTVEEKLARRRAFDRAAWGARLIWLSFLMFMASMVFIGIYFFQFGLQVVPSPAFITLAGILGLVNWASAAAGVGLCLSGPRGPGHWGYGISAAVATAVHLVFLLALLAQNKEYCIGRYVDRATGERTFARWSMLTTRIDATMFYMTAAVYPHEQGVTPREPMGLSMITGVVEMVRTMLIMMLLSCLSRAALDEDLAHKCTRTAGIVSGGPALVAFLMLTFAVVVIETNAGLNLFTIILFSMVNMGVYFILLGVLLPAYLAAREVIDACEEPFQSLVPKL